MHVVAVLALPGVIALDLSVPCQVFETVRLADGSRPYEVRVCTAGGEVASGACGPDLFELRAPWRLGDAVTASTVIVPGLCDPNGAVPSAAIATLRSAADRGARIAAICTGAFVLAEAGVLNGRRATTHWRYAAQLADVYPEVRVDPHVLFVDDKEVLTSAGIAGLDLCLHIVSLDHGAAVAAEAARQIVTPPRRDGGQVQFIVYEDPAPAGAGLSATMQWMRENLHLPLTLAEIARHAGLSTRSLSRRFREQTGSSTLRWLVHQRLTRAKQLLETTDLPIDRVAAAAGFGSPVSLRQHFARHLATSPNAYRRAARGPGSPRPVRTGRTTSVR